MAQVYRISSDSTQKKFCCRKIAFQTQPYRFSPLLIDEADT